MNIVHLVELILVLAILIAVGLPLFSSARRHKLYSSPDELLEEYKHLLVRKEEILLAIKESEFDLKTDKLSDDDYRETRSKLEKEAVGILERLDDMEGQRRRTGGKASPAIKADVA
jgi:hypothetical protein